MDSDNPSGADNQQETSSVSRALDPFWVVGFVDGEGCFSVSLHRNPRFAKATRGWQLNPVFHVYQHEQHRDVLERLVDVFGCGCIRPKGPNSRVLTYAVDSMTDLSTAVLPFFERYELQVKRDDFSRFAEIVRSMRRKEHLNPAGFERLVRLAFAMNANGKQRKSSLEEVLCGSSETARQAPRELRPVGKIQSDPCGDTGSQAEMT